MRVGIRVWMYGDGHVAIISRRHIVRRLVAEIVFKYCGEGEEGQIICAYHMFKIFVHILCPLKLVDERI